MKKFVPNILIVLPMAYQDGIGKHNGIMRFLSSRNITWNIFFNRMTSTWADPTIDKKTRYDGIILDGSGPDKFYDAYRGIDCPTVTFDWHRNWHPGRRNSWVLISSDATSIGQAAAETLSATSEYASVAYAPTANSFNWVRNRGKAFRKALSARGIKSLCLNALLPFEDQLLQLPKPAAVFAANDVIAIKVLDAAKHVGISIPADLSVLGVDNESCICLHSIPTLSSIQPDFEEAGFLAAKALQTMIERRPTPMSHRYRVKCVVRRKSMEPASPAGKLVLRALEAIRTIDDPLMHVDDIATKLGVSRRLLDKRFRQIDGRSVLEAIQDQKLKRICTLLKTTRLSIREICENCCFRSPTYPMQLFHKRFGMTMRAWRSSQ